MSRSRPHLWLTLLAFSSLSSCCVAGTAHQQVLGRPADENDPIPDDPSELLILRKALMSPDSQVVIAAAARLTRAHDRNSIPLIAETCKRFHDPDQVRQIAHTLREFLRDPETRAAAEAGEDLCLPPPDPIDALKRNTQDSMVYVGKAATAHPKETVSILKQNFASTQDQLLKGQIASALLELGDKQDLYWDFFLRQAISALENASSSTLKYDAGKAGWAFTVGDAGQARSDLQHGIAVR